jgi:hypothetical protein
MTNDERMTKSENAREDYGPFGDSEISVVREKTDGRHVYDERND